MVGKLRDILRIFLKNRIAYIRINKNETSEYKMRLDYYKAHWITTLSCPPHVVVKFRHEKICRISAVRVLKIRTCAFFLVSLNLVLVVALRSN